MKFELVEPQMDKGWSFQVSSKPPEYIPEDVRTSLISLLKTPIVKRAKPFLQGDCMGWMMVEFWTDNEEAILTASLFLQNSLK